MRRAIRALAAAALLAGASLTTFAVAGPASADTQICDQYGSTTIGGRYVVMNNRWGTSAQQCINVTSTGFSIASQQGTGSTSGAPVSYPAVYYGCHYTNCSPGTVLPKQLSTITSATSSIDYTFVSGATYDASYDIWLDPTPKKDGVNQQEVMIWFNRQGSIQPIGSVIGSATIGGRTWQVWQGGNGSNQVISYVAPSPISSWNFSVLDFLNNVKTHTSVTNSWSLTSIQAGFEPWQGGTGLGLNSFSASVNGVGGGAKPAAPQSCRVSYTPTSWNDGFTTTVAITNTSTTAIHGWKLTFPFAAGQKVAKAWTSTVSQNGTTVTAANSPYNGSIAPNGSVSFVLQGTHGGANPSPTAFNLNGTACTAG
jgi:hypothetical protein